MLLTLTPSQAVEAMVEHVRANLQLQDRRESGNKRVITLRGRGVSETDYDVPFALEVVIQTGVALPYNYFDEIVMARSSQQQGGTNTGILFPKSIDYETAEMEVMTPYFRQANLIPDWADPKLRKRYERFDRYDVKDLSRLEWKFAIPLSGYRVAYFNPLKGNLQAHQFLKFDWNEILPDNRPKGERVPAESYFWDFVEEGRFPNASDPPRKARTFRGIQKGLHDRVRRIISTEDIEGKFTLTRWYSDELKANGARAISYKGN